MKKCLRLIVLLLCIFSAGYALAENSPLAPENMGERFLMQDGVIYWIGKEEALAVDFLTDAEHITVHAKIEGKPVRCESIRWSDGLAKSIMVEKDVAGLEYVYISGFCVLETVEIRAAVNFVASDFPDDRHVYLLDCPALTSFRVYENTQPAAMLWEAASCPKLTVFPPSAEETEPPQGSYYTPTLFTEEDFLGETTYVIPEGTAYAEIRSAEVLWLELPSTLKQVSVDAPNLLEIVVSNANPDMLSENGVLYAKDYSSLIAYPSGRKDTTYTVHPDTEWVNDLSSKSLETIILPNHASFMESDGFHCPNLVEVVYPRTYAVEYDNASLVTHWGVDENDWDAAFSTYGKTSPWGTSQKGLRISAEEGSKTFAIIDGLLYSKDGKTLLRVPPSTRGMLVLPEKTERIAPLAMKGCVDIETLVLPATLEALSAENFFGLAGLKAFSVAEENPYFQTLDGVLFSKDGATLLARPPLHGRTYTLPNDTKHVSKLAFLSNEMLEEVRMPMGVETVGERAFQSNRALVSINLSPSITEIGDYAFENCYKIEKLVLPKGMKQVGRIVGFSGQQELDWYDYDNPHRKEDVTPIEIWIPGTIQLIASDAFTYSSGFTGRTADELLLVVEEDSEGHFIAKNENIPYCFPDQVELAREGFLYVLLVGDVGERVSTYLRPSVDAPGSSYPEGTALLWLGEQDGFCVAQIGEDIVYVKNETCRVVPETRRSWPFSELKMLRHDAFLYAQPTTDSPVCSMPADLGIYVLTVMGPWCNVYTTEGNGYMLRQDLYGPDYWNHKACVQLPAISGQLPVYAYPSDDAKVIAWLTNGMEIPIKKATQEGWVFIGSGYIWMQEEVISGNPLPLHARH